MKKIQIRTSSKRMLADVYTPVGIYLRLRDKFRDTILLESTDSHAADNSFSFICINAIAGIEISATDTIEHKVPGESARRQPITDPLQVPSVTWEFMNRFDCEKSSKREERFAQGLFGYSGFDAVQFFEQIKLPIKPSGAKQIPSMRYRLYQYVIVFNHFKDELHLCENRLAGVASDASLVESLIRSKDVPVYPFQLEGDEVSNMSDEDYREMVRKGIASCKRGDVFQIVLSRRFDQRFRGDEFNVYRSLRSVNPSPYLFFFDYGDYKLMGSSPEAQLVIAEGEAVMHPIAGTFRRTGDDEQDRLATERLRVDPKENAEHVMLVDLARNDLSRRCSDVEVSNFKEVQYFSHVIHLVSEVKGNVKAEENPFSLLATTFPAGTLSGAPKYKAMQLISQYEPTSRGYYGGTIGFVGFDGSFNHAIMIRSFLSRHNTLSYQAGAGVVVSSVPESELQEVNHKLGALKKALLLAEDIN